MAGQNKEQYASRNNGQPKVGGASNAANLSQGAVPARTATTGPAGGNPAAGGAAKGGTGGVNTQATKQATGTRGPAPGPQGAHNSQSPHAAGTRSAGPSR